MAKRRRGSCPMFLVIGMVVLLMVASIGKLLTSTAFAVDYEGGLLPPPGGQWPSTETTTTQQPDTPPSGEDVGLPGGPSVDPVGSTEPTTPGTIVTPNDPVVQDPEEPPVDPELPPAEPEVVEDPVGRYPSKPDSLGVKIVSPSLDSLLAEGADLEALLYPSGLKLPTKYMDLLMCAPVNSSTNVIGETANFLKTIAPNSTGQYTYAEYEAADIYLAMCRCYLQEEGESLTGDALKNLDVNTTVNWMNNVTNATISDYSKLVALISNYRSILESAGNGESLRSHKQYKDLVADHRSVYYSFGDLKAYGSLAEDGFTGDYELSKYTSNLYSTWSYLGISQGITTNLLEYSHFYNEFALNGVNYNRGAPPSSFTPKDTGSQEPTGSEGVPGNSTQVTSPDHANDGSMTVTGSSGQEWTNPNTQGSGDTPVSSVGSNQGVDTSVLPSGRQNALDIASKVALAFVVIGIIAVWAIHTHRKGSDPLSKWK